jgi:hypothetical protein
MWEISTMETVTKFDARGRDIFSAPFQLGGAVIREYQESNRVTSKLLKPADVPVVKCLRKRGFSILKAPAASRPAIADALRAQTAAR